MTPPALRALPLLFPLGVVAIAACGGGGAGVVSAGDPSRPVPVQEWCASVGRSFCGELGGRCLGGGVSECEQGFVPNCLGQRDGNAPSGRVQGEVASCAAHLRALACNDLVNPAQLAPCQLVPGL